jgi:hypothetical protein
LSIELRGILAIFLSLRRRRTDYYSRSKSSTDRVQTTNERPSIYHISSVCYGINGEPLTNLGAARGDSDPTVAPIIVRTFARGFGG